MTGSERHGKRGSERDAELLLFVSLGALVIGAVLMLVYFAAR